MVLRGKGKPYSRTPRFDKVRAYVPASRALGRSGSEMIIERQFRSAGIPKIRKAQPLVSFQAQRLVSISANGVGTGLRGSVTSLTPQSIMGLFNSLGSWAAFVAPF